VVEYSFMKNIYQSIAEKFLLHRKSLSTLTIKWLCSLKKDFALHNANTELLAIWTVLFITITGLFVLAIKSSILVMLTLFLLSIAIMFIGIFAAIYYLHVIKHGNSKQLASKVHRIFNKSFKLRTMLKSIKIPSFRKTVKLNFKFSS